MQRYIFDHKLSLPLIYSRNKTKKAKNQEQQKKIKERERDKKRERKTQSSGYDEETDAITNYGGSN